MSPNGDAASIRLAPHSAEAEQALLGAVLINPDSYYDVSHFIQAGQFFVIKHGWVWEAMTAVLARGEALDYLSLADELKHAGRLGEIGGPAYLTQLMNHTPSSLYAETYGRIVERAAIRRGMLDAASEIARLAHDDEQDAETALDLAGAALARVSAGRADETEASLSEVMDSVLDVVRRGQNTGIPTGYTDIDQMLGGLQRSDLLIVAGRPGMGKTSFLLGAALYAAQHGARVKVFTMEMSREQLGHRLLAIATGVTVDQQRTGRMNADEIQRVEEAAERQRDLPWWIDDTPALTPAQLEAKARRAYNEHGLDLIILDYVQLMTAPGKKEANRVQELSAITRSLKLLARSLNVPVMAAAQLSRAVEQRQDKRPVLSDLRESGSLEQDADVVMFIYRDEVYNDQTERPNEADIIIAKQRNGPTGTARLYFMKERTKFGNLRRDTLDLRGYDE